MTKVTATIKFYEFSRQVKSSAMERVSELNRAYDSEFVNMTSAAQKYMKLSKLAKQAEKQYIEKLAAGTVTDEDENNKDTATEDEAKAFAKLTADEIVCVDNLRKIKKQIANAMMNPMIFNPEDRVALSIPGEQKLLRVSAKSLGVSKKDAGRQVSVEIVRKNNEIVSVKKC